MLHSFSLFYIRAKTEEPVRLTGDEISCVKNVEDSSSDWWQKSRKVLRGWSGSETFPVLDLIRSACYLSQCFSISSGKLIKLLDGACQPFFAPKSISIKVNKNALTSLGGGWLLNPKVFQKILLRTFTK